MFLCSTAHDGMRLITSSNRHRAFTELVEKSNSKNGSASRNRNACRAAAMMRRIATASDSSAGELLLYLNKGLLDSNPVPLMTCFAFSGGYERLISPCNCLTSDFEHFKQSCGRVELCSAARTYQNGILVRSRQNVLSEGSDHAATEKPAVSQPDLRDLPL